jgi:hypothetical protein
MKSEKKRCGECVECGHSKGVDPRGRCLETQREPGGSMVYCGCKCVFPATEAPTVAFMAYNQAVNDAKAAIRGEKVDDPYTAATFISAIARKCSPHRYVAQVSDAPADEIIAAIADMQGGRDSHQQWLDHLSNSEREDCKGCDGHAAHIGDVEHHRQWIEKYDRVIRLLAEVPGVATTGAGEDEQRCAGCGRMVDVELLLCPTCVDKGHAKCCPPATVGEGEARCIHNVTVGTSCADCAIDAEDTEHLLAAPTPVQPVAAVRDDERDPRDDGSKCQRCGTRYTVDIMVSDETWAKVRGDENLLCGPCIVGSLEITAEADHYYLTQGDTASTPTSGEAARELALRIAEIHPPVVEGRWDGERSRIWVLQIIGLLSRHFPSPEATQVAVEECCGEFKQYQAAQVKRLETQLTTAHADAIRECVDESKKVIAGWRSDVDESWDERPDLSLEAADKIAGAKEIIRALESLTTKEGDDGPTDKA